MSSLNFFSPPRFGGNPFQTLFTDTPSLLSFIKDAQKTGKPCFVSHNRFPQLNGITPYTVEINKIFFDLDSPKLENCLLDLRKLITFCTDNSLSFACAFSGSKGFHFYLLLSPETYIIGDFIKDTLRALNIWFSQLLGLRTLDPKCIDPTRLCRVWYTKHSKYDKTTSSYKQNGLYCYPLTADQALTWNVPTILDHAKHPTLISPPILTPTLTLSTFLSSFQINPAKIIHDNRDSSSKLKPSQFMPSQPIEDIVIKKLLPRPCIHQQMVHSPNPPHFIRFCSVVQLKSLGYSRRWIFDFFKERNYIDAHNVETCAYQINHIFDHSPEYKHPSCSTIIRNGFCIGKACPKFFL